MPKNSSVLESALSTPRPGTTSAPTLAPAETVAAGLELSDIEYRPASFFTLNPANEVFRAMKPEAYLADLARDIAENGITDPIIAMPDGLIIAGESRLVCAERAGLKKLPVRFITSDLSADEQEKRLVLNNLLRFEIDKDTRLALLYKVGFYDRPAAEAADSLGISPRQVKRDRADIREAERIAAEKGKSAPEAEEFREARETRREARRSSTPSEKVGIIRIESILAEMDALGGELAEYATKIREALG